ncbi:hypothetical protein CY34DRAFT_805794 [Suillus luteus UH-Slu-Lm8-n1]|uniref:Uncharacterized protein n=1 Tax=Suillus luteus UH-Slu-Lm8-n1 TaxID=930992 RepID=A0A0D0B5A1_9AGAM|nr:hypothetical protein CY34DRAFT_805794 [Suillus luteus UH-Slu-Lm8-n1]
MRESSTKKTLLSLLVGTEMTRQTTVTPSLSLGRDCMHCGTALSGVKLNNHEYRTCTSRKYLFM